MRSWAICRKAGSTGPRLEPVGEHPHGHRPVGGLHGPRPDVLPGDRGRVDRGEHRQPVGGRRAGRQNRLTLLVDEQGDGSGRAAAEDLPQRRSGPPRLERVLDLAVAGLELGRPGSLELARHDGVHRDAEHEQHDERRQPAPGDQPEADATDQAGIGGQARIGGRVVARGTRNVRHRADGTRRRGPSRSTNPPGRAWSGGSGRRHRRRSA